MLSPPSSSPVRLSVVVSWTGSRSPRSPPVFPDNGSHPVAPPFPPRVPVSRVPRGQRYYEGATTSHLASPVAYLFRFRGPRNPPLFVLALAALPDGWRTHPGQGTWSAGHPVAGTLSRGRRRDLTGSQAIHPVPLPRSKTPAGPTIPHPDGVVDAAPAQPTAKAPAIIISRLLTRLQHLLPTLHDGRRRTPCKARFRLVG